MRETEGCFGLVGEESQECEKIKWNFKEIVRKEKRKKKGKNFGKEKKNIYKSYLVFFVFISVLMWLLKFRHISILFNFLTLGMAIMQIICHVDIFY